MIMKQSILIHRMIFSRESLEYKGEMKWLKVKRSIGLYQVYFFDFDGVIINSDKIRVVHLICFKEF